MLSDRRQMYRLVIPDYQPQTWLNCPCNVSFICTYNPIALYTRIFYLIRANRFLIYTICWRHNIAEILPKLGLNINQSIKSCLWCLIDWCLTPTLAVFQLYRCRMSAKCQKQLRNQLNHIGQHGVNVLWKLAKYVKLPTIVVIVWMLLMFYDASNLSD
jgi:hypothetical protein